MKRIVLFLLVVISLSTCKKDELSEEEKLNQQKQEIVAKLKTIIPSEVVVKMEVHLKEMENKTDYSIYLDSLNIAVDNLIKAIETNFSLDEYRNAFNNTTNYLNSSPKKSSSGDCLGLGYAKAVELDLEVGGSAGYGIAAGLQLVGGGGIQVVYDFVNLGRQVYYYSFCGCGFTFGAGVGAALNAGVGFSGINEILTGIPFYGNEYRENIFEGASFSQTHDLTFDGALFGLEGEVAAGIGCSYEAEADFNGITNLLPCAERIVLIENGIKGYSFQVSGSISWSIGAEILAGYKFNAIGTNSHGVPSTFERYSEYRPLAGIRMAEELLFKGPFDYTISIPGAADIAASTIAIAYSLKDFTSCSNRLPSIGTNPVENITESGGACGGIIKYDGGSPITERGVFYGTSVNPELSGTKFQIGNGVGIFSATLAGLNANTTYYVKAYAVNSQGTGYGREICFKTSDYTNQNFYSNNFSNDLSDWTAYSGTWQIQNGLLYATYGIGCGSISCPQGDLLLNDQFQPIGDWRISVDFTYATDPSYPTHSASGAALTMFVSSSKKIRISVGGAGFNNWGSIQLDKIGVGFGEWNGTWYKQLNQEIDLTWLPTNWHTMTIEKTGNVYKIFVNNTYLAQFIDTYLNGTGKVGLQTYGPKRYDNFVIKKL